MHYGSTLDKAAFVEAIRTAYAQGIRTFMTADVYGEGESDTLLGEALKDFPRDSYCLIGAVGHDFYTGKRRGSKGFPRFTDPALRGEEEYASYLRMATERSLERLGLKHFDLLMLHNPDQAGYRSKAVWDGMKALKESGLTELLGIAPGPANGFTLDIIGAFEDYGDLIDWAMIILSPFEPWPGSLCLKAAEKFNVKIITRVVDYGGVFFDDVKPGHVFAPSDHRAFRPAGWVEKGNEKLELLRPYATKHGLTPMQLSCAWNFAQPMVECVVPTIIQEIGEDVRTFASKTAEIAELERLHKDGALTLSPEEVAGMQEIGNNWNSMALKGGGTQFLGEPQTDQWHVDAKLLDISKRWGVDPDRDLFYARDPRDLREKGLPVRGLPRVADRRLYVQLHAFTGADEAATNAAIEAVKAFGLDAVVYANVNDPRGLAVLVLTEEPETLAGAARKLLAGEPFSRLMPQPELTMLGRTYASGREANLEEALIKRPIGHATRRDWPWAIWYPLRWKGEVHQLSAAEEAALGREPTMINHRFGDAGYAGDIRLASYGFDQADNESVHGLVGPRLDWLSKLVEEFRGTAMASRYLQKVGPFFVGRAIWQSGD